MTRAFTLASWTGLGLAALNNLVRGGFHVLSSDGGVSQIPGLALGTEGATVIALFTLIGLNQTVIGAAGAAVLIWRRDLVLPMLGLQIALTAAAVANLHFGRPLPVPVANETFNQILLPLLAVAWVAGLAAARPERSALAPGPTRAT